MSRHALLAAEHPTVHVGAPYSAGLVWPNSYATGMASLGFLWAYEQLNRPGIVCCERYFADPALLVPGRLPSSLESGMALAACDVIAVSISYELDIANLVRLLVDSDIQPLREHRDDDDPLLIIGGPLTRSNYQPLLAIADVVVAGDGEPAMAALVESVGRGCVHKHDLVPALQEVPGVVKGGISSPTACHLASADLLPVVAPMVSANASLGDLLLVEVSRGCPKNCTFCLGRQGSAPLRLADMERVLNSLPPWAPGIGIIGAALGFVPGLERLLQWAADNDKRAGISSLRADRVDLEVARLLKQCGSETITVAADGPSQRLRDAISKDVTEADLVACAGHTANAGLNAMKMYVMLGLPGETDDDIVELAGLCNQLNATVPLLLGVSLFVPKRETPLADAPFVPVKELSRRVKLLHRECSGGVRVGRVSPREAALQYLLSHATEADGPAVVQAATAGGSFADYRAAFGPRLKALLR